MSAMPDSFANDPLSADFTGLPRRGEVLDGKYRIQGVVGRGGMAYVLSATHVHLDERVAIKVLRPEYADDAELVDRFMREGRAAIRIRSEHVVRVLDVGIVSKRPYLVMEYLEGKDLETILAEEGRLSVERTVDYVLQACEAIAEAHVAGIVHRDLKPANLFLVHRADQSESVKVLDFGISKVMKGPSDASGLRACGTRPSAFMGSPHYMSPEQMRSASDVDARADIWALGAIMHELLTGHPPFVADSIPALCLQVLSEPPAPLTSVRADVPLSLEAAVLKCLEVNVADRFANVAELASAIAESGTPAARASAASIQRVIESAAGGVVSSNSAPPAAWSGRRESSRDSARDSARNRQISAFDILNETAPTVPMSHPRLGYALAALFVVAVCVGGVMATNRYHPGLLPTVHIQMQVAGPTESLLTSAPALAPTVAEPPAAPVVVVPVTAAVVEAPVANAPLAKEPAAKETAAKETVAPKVAPRAHHPRRWHAATATTSSPAAAGDGALPTDMLPLTTPPTPPVDDNPYAAPASAPN